MIEIADNFFILWICPHREVRRSDDFLPAFIWLILSARLDQILRSNFKHHNIKKLPAISIIEENLVSSTTTDLIFNDATYFKWQDNTFSVGEKKSKFAFAIPYLQKKIVQYEYINFIGRFRNKLMFLYWTVAWLVNASSFSCVALVGMTNFYPRNCLTLERFLWSNLGFCKSRTWNFQIFFY